jgi:hypothetical protein
VGFNEFLLLLEVKIMCQRLSHRPWIIVSVATLAAAVWAVVPVSGQQPEGGPEAAAAKVPVKRIVLFNSGVGYFEHQGQVEGETTVDLKFNVDDVNDLLKSMIVQDLGGGQISTVTYGSRDPITKTLQTFAIDLTSNPTLGDLLGQIRGEAIEIDAPTRIRGTIVGVEKQKKSVGENQIIEIELLTVLTDEGLRRIALDSIGRIKLAKEELDAELRQALAVLAMGHATDKKTVSLKFLGDGQRDVRVGYIQEAPVWKTSYRLVLDDEDNPFLQGWAIVENTTETDWQDVQLSLVSGRPISFVMDLYSPLYAQRPVVVPELYASLRPQTYERDLLAREELGQRLERSSTRAMRRGGETPEQAAAPAAPSGGFGGAGFAAGVSKSAFPNFTADIALQSVEVAAQGAEVGELFQYDIETPVALARQRSAMLPILNGSLEGKKVSIYNAGVHAKHPLNAIELKNTSDLHLMQGPVTVFDGGVYAGDAQLADLPPGSERLLSYALDLDVEVAPTTDARPQHLVSARIEKGVLFANYKQSRTNTYRLKNSGNRERSVLVEHPIDTSWELLSPEASEKTRGVYRFAVAVKPGGTEDLKIEEEQIIRQSVAVTNLDDTAMGIYLSAKEVSAAVKDALREVIHRKTELSNLQQRKQQLEQEIAVIAQEQERIRNNMRSIDRNTDLYNRYVKKFTEQEDQVENHREEIRGLETQITEKQRSLDDYLSNLDLS